MPDIDFESLPKLSRKMYVLPDGTLRISWGEDPDKRVNILQDIDSAIRQAGHVVKDYRGFEREVDGIKVKIPGELEVISKSVGALNKVIGRLLEMSPLKQGEFRNLERKFGVVLGDIERSIDRFKVAARTRLERVVITDEHGGINPQGAVITGEAVVDLLRRHADAAIKSFGTVKRGRILIDEKLRCEDVFEKAFSALGSIQFEFCPGRIITKARLIEMGEIVTGRSGILEKINSVKVNPYYQRILSREIQRLARLPAYAKDGKADRFKRALEGAIKKMDPVLEDRENRKVERPVFSETGRLVSSE